MRWNHGFTGWAMVGAVLTLAAGVLCGNGPAPAPHKDDSTDYRAVVARTAAMVSDADVRKRAAAHKLDVLNLTWEDTGRYKNSAVGPNISDMTIQVQQKDAATGQYFLTCMPVIRFPNFADRTADVRLDRFFLLVGNEKGRPLRRISLWDYLGNVREHLTRPESWKGDGTYLLANRDTHVLVSAQACFLPVPKRGRAEFNPVLFNYQSVKDDPAVLTILVTREGTSATVIDNHRDGFQANGVWGQRLFFNHKGERASLTGERLSDFLAGPKGKPPAGKPAAEAAGQKGLNMVLLIQVPLKQKRPPGLGAGADGDLTNTDPGGMPLADSAVRLASDVEAAVVGHGAVEGPYTEMAGLAIERDPRFPIRVTVQFYKATSNGVVSDNDLAEIAGQINKVYAQGDYLGSLVTEGLTDRPTEYDGPKTQPPDWWEQFWKRYEADTGHTRADVLAAVRRNRGEDWFPRNEQVLADEATAIHWPPLSAAGIRGLRAGSWAAAGLALLLVAGVAVLYLRRRPRTAGV